MANVKVKQDEDPERAPGLGDPPDLEARVAMLEAIVARLKPHLDKIIETAHRFS